MANNRIPDKIHVEVAPTMADNVGNTRYGTVRLTKSPTTTPFDNTPQILTVIPGPGKIWLQDPRGFMARVNEREIKNLLACGIVNGCTEKPVVWVSINNVLTVMTEDQARVEVSMAKPMSIYKAKVGDILIMDDPLIKSAVVLGRLNLINPIRAYLASVVSSGQDLVILATMIDGSRAALRNVFYEYGRVIGSVSDVASEKASVMGTPCQGMLISPSGKFSFTSRGMIDNSEIADYVNDPHTLLKVVTTKGVPYIKYRSQIPEPIVHNHSYKDMFHHSNIESIERFDITIS